MTKFLGLIGFGKTVETRPGVFEMKYEEKLFRGQFVRRSYRPQITEAINNDLTMTKTIELTATTKDATQLPFLKYVVINGTKWSIVEADYERPKLTITTGGVYTNG